MDDERSLLGPRRSRNQYPGYSSIREIDDSSADQEQLIVFGSSSNHRTEEEQGSSWYASVFIVVNAALGAGLLNFPYSYMTAGGVVPASIIHAILIVAIIVSLAVLIYCADIKGSTSYQALMLDVCGKKAKMACSVSVILYCFGTCITFLIIIADQLDKFWLFNVGETFCLKWYLNRKFTVFTSSLFLILPLCFSKRIDFLKIPSAVGVLAVLYVVLLVTIKYFTTEIHRKDRNFHDIHMSFIDLFSVIPTICFSYQCHVSVIPVYSCLRPPRRISDMLKTILLAVLICAVSYMLTAVFGYWSFGIQVNPDILVSYDDITPDVLVAMVAISAKTYTTYPILLFCARLAMQSICEDISARAAEWYMRVENGLILLWFGATVILALVIPNIADVIGLLGALATLFVFVFPGVCLLKTSMVNDDLQVMHTMNLQAAADGRHVEQYKWKRRFLLSSGLFFIIIGAFLLGVVVTQSIIAIAHPGSTILPPVCQ